MEKEISNVEYRSGFGGFAGMTRWGDLVFRFWFLVFRRSDYRFQISYCGGAGRWGRPYVGQVFACANELHTLRVGVLVKVLLGFGDLVLWGCNLVLFVTFF